MERVEFQTEDQVIIVGSFLTAPAATCAALLLHMMPADRNSWMKLQDALSKRGIASLAIDMRGHGESIMQEGRRIHYRDFTDKEHQTKVEDARAALRWLAGQGFEAAQVALVGASIGANLALNIAAENPAVPAIGLFSPGENYHGVLTYAVAERLRPEQSLWVTASQGDDQQSFEAAQEIIRRAPSKEKVFHPLVSAGHGTNIFDTQPTLADDLADWLSRHVSTHL